MTLLNSKVHKQTFYTRGTYSVTENKIDMATEIPTITIPGPENNHNLSLESYHDISSENIPCMLVIYSHGHPTHREKLPAENLDWDRKALTLDEVFKTNAPQGKIFVITLHDEDFEDWHIAIYRFFVQHHVSFDTTSNEYEYDLQILQNFVAGKPVEIIVEEEPRTVNGGVIDPA